MTRLLLVLSLLAATVTSCAPATCDTGITLWLERTPPTDNQPTRPYRFTALCGERVLGRWWAPQRTVPRCAKDVP